LGSKIYTVPYGGEEKKKDIPTKKSQDEKNSRRKNHEKNVGQTDNQTEQNKKNTHLGKRRLLLALAWRRRVDLGDEIVVDVDRFSLLLSLV
jgi:hypothetical protein